MMMRRWVMVMAVLAAGCGSDDSSGSGGTAGKDAGSGGSAGSAGSGGSGATAGTAGSGGLAGTGGGTAGSGGMSGSSGTAGSAGAAGGTASCDSTNCEWTCCGDQCVNTTNDFKNCGACGKACTGQNPFCDNGTCKPNPPCDSGTQCPGVALCCGGNCCAAGDICCDVPGPVVTGVACTKPTAEGSCPLGCKTCVCTSPDTPIATPSGERAIAELRVGDLVYSVDHGATVAVPGSHLWGEERVAGPGDETVKAIMPAGSCILFLGNLWHGGGENRSGADRLAVTAQYCEPWVRTQENYFLSVPPHTVAAVSENIRRMLGYSIHPPFMGMVNGMHPKRMLPGAD